MLGTKFKNIRIGLIDLKSHNLFSILQATQNVGYKAKVIFLAIIKPFLDKSYNLNCNNLEFAKLLIICQIQY